MKLLYRRACSLLLAALFLPGLAQAEDAWRLVFADEFEAERLDGEKWAFDVGADIWGNQEAQYYTDGANAFLEDGCLVLEARAEPCEGKRYTSARLTTHRRFDFRYGRIEVRCALPLARGTWSAIWLLPSERVFGRGTASGEIDLLEHVGHEPHNVYATVHTDARNAGKDNAPSAKAKLDDPAAFHTYTLTWTPTSIAMAVDGVEILQYVPEDSGDWRHWPFGEQFYLLLNIAVGGTWGGMQGIDDDAFPQRMRIDYVRIYQQEEA